jgi:hypothetical protein
MRIFSATGFAAIILFFALPFGAVVECGGDRHFDWTGVDLLTASVEAGPEDAEDAAEVEGRWILAWPVFLCAVAGLALAVHRRARFAGWVAAVGFVATWALAEQEVPNELPGWGLVLTLLTFAVLTVVHAVAAPVRWWRRRRERGERHDPRSEAFR